MNAIILDGNLKSALAAVRSLGKAGVPVSVGAERETGMSLHSRYATGQFVYPSPYTDQRGFIDAVKNEALRLGDKPIVFAFSDATYLSLFIYREELLQCATLLFPEEKSIEIAFNKAATYSLARISGIPTITTYAPEFDEEVIQLSETMSFPVVLKTKRSVTWAQGIGVFGTAQFVHTKEDLRLKFTELRKKVGEAPLIQEMVFGEEYGVEMLVHKGKPYATVTHHRLRSLSPTGGASVLKETIETGELRSSLEEYAGILVEKLNWSGPIMVEFKVDGDSRVPYLMEINGRFWGSLPLSVASGVDMPYLYYEYALKKKTPETMITGRGDVVTRHFLGDVRHLLQVFFSKDTIRPLLYPKRLTALHNFFSIPPGTQSDVWSLHDPKPALMEIIDIFQKYIWKRKK